MGESSQQKKALLAVVNSTTAKLGQILISWWFYIGVHPITPDFHWCKWIQNQALFIKSILKNPPKCYCSCMLIQWFLLRCQHLSIVEQIMCCPSQFTQHNKTHGRFKKVDTHYVWASRIMDCSRGWCSTRCKLEQPWDCSNLQKIFITVYKLFHSQEYTDHFAF